MCLLTYLYDIVYSTMYYNLIGGVMSINRENYYRANGFSNVYWGWGSEDDDFSARYLNHSASKQ